jgi:hypothetical protein
MAGTTSLLVTDRIAARRNALVPSMRGPSTLF